MTFHRLAKVLVLITCVHSAPVLAQENSTTPFELPPVYSSISEARTDPAFTDGVVIQTDGSYLRAESLAAALLTKDIKAAVVNGGLQTGMIRFFLDGQTSEQVFYTEEQFGHNATRVLHSLSVWNARKRQEQDK